MIGQTISHYKILEKLGEGGMGVVYKAQDTRLDRAVALKFLPSSLITSQDEAVRFQQEAKAISSLNHPNVATIYGLDEADAQRFLVLEYLPSGTLKSKIKDLYTSGRELSLAQVVDYGLQIAEGLAHAHRHGIIHRDVKTDNMMLSEEGKVKITDFGLAKLRGGAHVTKSGSTVGTAAYMSPEQIRGEEADHRADLFSLGVVLYELATGHLPFRGEHEAALSYSIVNEEPVPIKSLRSAVPSSLERVIHRCLEKDGEKRFQSGEEIVSELRKLQQEFSGPVTATPKTSKLPWIVTAAVVLIGLIALYVFFPSKPVPAETKSIAVLPFVDMSPLQDQEYFCDGITEELINTLAKLEGLHVVARSSAFQFKGKNIDVRTMGEELSVSTVLEGSVRKAGNTLRITAQLINVADGYHLWSETYERKLEDVFAIQEDISRSIVDALKIKLVDEAEAPIVKRHTDNLEAYNLYLQGRYYWNKRTEAGLKTAIRYFAQAVKKDSSYAIAYAGQADCYSLLPHYGFFSPSETLPKAKAAALKALQIDNTLAEAHTSIALVAEQDDWKPLEAEIEYKKAIELNPNYATAHHWYAFCLSSLGRPDEAVSEMERAWELEPLSLPINRDLGQHYYLAGRYDQAIDQLRKTVEMDSSFATAHSDLGMAYVQKGMFEEAIAHIEKGADLSGRFPGIVAELGYAYAVAGMRDKALELVDEITELSRQKYVSSFYVAKIYTGLGDRESAIEALEKAYEEHFVSGFYVRAAPEFHELRSDPRVNLLLKKMGLE